jgi:uncharacterized protein (TIGR02246 family)
MDDERSRRLQAWVDGYVQAWNSNEPAEIGALFTQDAAYYTEPYSPPWHGRDQIVRRWLDRKDKPGQTEFRWHPLAVTPTVAIVQAETVYRSPPHIYSNLWVLRLDAEGRCAEFTEWWMRHPAATDSLATKTTDAP